MAESSSYQRLTDALGEFTLSGPVLVKGPAPGSAEPFTVWLMKAGRASIAPEQTGVSGSLELTAVPAPGRAATLGQVLCESVLFANSQTVTRAAAKVLLKAVGKRLIRDIDENDYSFSDVAIRSGANFIAERLGLGRPGPDQLLEHLVGLLTARAAPDVDRFRAGLDPAFRRAADLLSKAPVHEVSDGALKFYMAYDVDEDARAEVADRRCRAAAPFPALSGYFASVPVIADAIDAGDKLFRAVEEATAGAITKPIMTRLGQTSDSRARVAVASGLLTNLPPDQYPRTDAQWSHALDLWDASCQLADVVRVPVSTVWNADRIVQAKGDWEGLARAVITKGVDARPPFGLGLTKEDSAEIAGILKIKPFGPEDDVYGRIETARATAAAHLQVISERDGRAAGAECNWVKFSEWILRLGHRALTPETLFASLRGGYEAASLFGQRVILPTALVAERLPGLPITSGLTQAATSAAFEFLAEPLTFPNLAAFGRQFTARAPFLTAPILSAREAAEPGPAAEAPAEKVHIDDSKWRQIFRITEDKPDWPVITPIMEVMPGIVVVPLENMVQAREEGTLTPGKLDRNGVPEMNHCIGVIHAPDALQQAGRYQLFSIRSVVNGKYTRLASGTFRMSYAEDIDGLKIQTPGNHQFNGPSNVPPPAIAREAFELYKEFVESTPAALNPAVIKAVKGAAELQNKPVIRPDHTLPKLLGYNPFQVYKIETAWENWRDQGLISPEWLERPLGERARLPAFAPVFAAITKTLRLMDVDPGIRPVEPDQNVVKPIPAVKSPKGMHGVFI
jgi:hypothetical protein